MNKYVDFVSDKDFLECVKHVVDFYLSDEYKEEPIVVLKESKNDIDAIKTIFDVSVKQIGFDDGQIKKWKDNKIKQLIIKLVNFTRNF